MWAGHAEVVDLGSLTPHLDDPCDRGGQHGRSGATPSERRVLWLVGYGSMASRGTCMSLMARWVAGGTQGIRRGPMQAWVSFALGVGQLLATHTPAWKQRGPDLKHSKQKTQTGGAQCVEQRGPTFRQILFCVPPRQPPPR